MFGQNAINFPGSNMISGFTCGGEGNLCFLVKVNLDQL